MVVANYENDEGNSKDEDIMGLLLKSMNFDTFQTVAAAACIFVVSNHYDHHDSVTMIRMRMMVVVMIMIATITMTTVTMRG